MNAYNITTEKLVFSARLTPYRSLSQDGFRILLGAVGAICLSIGLVFCALGLWPVLGFMGLDVLLVYWAFKSNYRSAKAYEDIEVSRQHVLLRKISPNGNQFDHEFPQFGTRFDVERHDEIGITKMQLSNRERKVEFGSFMNPLDRESFTDALRRALSIAKG